MKKKCLRLFGIFVVALFIGTSKISAKITGGAASSSGVGGGAGGGNYNGSWENGVFEGIRLTLVDSNGNRISGTRSIDFKSNQSSSSFNNNGNWSSQAYYNSAKNSKKELWDRNGNPTFEVTLQTIDIKELGDFVGDPSYSFPFYQGTFNTNIEGKQYFYNLFYRMARDNASGFKKILDAMVINGTYADFVKKQYICGSLKDGYLIIEPITAITIQGDYYILTASEAILIARQLNSNNLYNSAGWRYNMYFSIYVDNTVSSLAGFSEVESIKAKLNCPNFNECYDVPSVHEFNNYKTKGYSVGVFKFSDLYSEIPCAKICYEPNYSCEHTACEKTNQNNDRTCSVKMDAIECENDDDITFAHQSGKKTIDLIEGVCSLYCTETATVSYPGNVSGAITLGTNLEWPTNPNGLYPLTTTSTLTCKVEMNEDESATVTADCLNAAKAQNYSYINQKGAKLVYSAPEKSGQSYYKSVTQPDIMLNQSCDSKISVNSDKVVIINNCSYSLPSDKNIAIDKKTIEFIGNLKETASASITNYIIMKNGGVLPIEGYHWKDSTVISSKLFSEKYKLEIDDMPLGYEGQFIKALNETDYICNYKITDIIGDDCQCPPGSEYSGVDLTGNIESSPTTCAEAIELYCNNKITCTTPMDEEKDITQCIKDGTNQKECEIQAGCLELCPEDSNMPNYPYQEDPNYQSCISGGGTKETCRNMICNPVCEEKNCEYTCPNDTPKAGMDITSCVYRNLGAGYGIDKSKELCYKIADCYGKGTGNIIYRTISLENPFPSIDADTTTSQTDLTIGKFNDTVKGRYPGTNWNGVKLVYNKILNNRGYDGSAIYQEATPLYVIELDAASVRKIRNYNKQQSANDDGYSDFTLQCTDGAYCISSFLHDKFATIVTGGTCQSIHNKQTFKDCYTTK